jgi:hypothetical protein
MRNISDAMPSEFIRLDEEVVQADRFVNVRNQQVMRDNHNALCMGGHMRPVFADELAATYSASSFPSQIIPAEGWAGLDERRHLTGLYNQDIFVSQHVKKLKLYVQLRIASGYDAEFYAGLFTRARGNRTMTNFTSTASSTTWHTVDLTMPVLARNNSHWRQVTFRLMWTPSELGSDRLGTPAAISAVGRHWCTVTTSAITGVAVGDVMYFTGAGPGYATDTSIEPRIIQGRIDSGANTTFYARDTMPWVEGVPTTSHYLQAKGCALLELFSVQLYEYARSGNYSDMVQEI